MRIPPWALALGGLAVVLGLVSSAQAARAPIGGPLLVSLWYYAASHVDDAFWSGDPTVWASLDIINPRVLIGAETSRMVRLDEVVKLCQRFNKRLDGHGAVNARSINEAVAEAEAAAEACARYGITQWHANAEDQWAGTSGKPRTADPEGTMAAYGAAFQSRCRELGIAPRLAWTNYSWAATSDGRPLATRKSLADFVVWSPMVYPNGADGGAGTLRRLWHERVYRLDAAGLERYRLAPLLPTGRKAADGTYWGDWTTLREVVQTEARPVSEVGLYYGAGSLGMLTKGNDRARPLPVEIQALRDAYRARWA